MGEVYVLMSEQEARRVLKKLQRLWDAEKQLREASAAHDGTLESYRRLDRAAAAYSHARFAWQLESDERPHQDTEE